MKNIFGNCDAARRDYAYSYTIANSTRIRIWTDWNNAAIVRPAAKGLGKITATDIEFAKQNSKNQSLDIFLYHALNKWFERI